jgi:hypothetical protein
MFMSLTANVLDTLAAITTHVMAPQTKHSLTWFLTMKWDALTAPKLNDIAHRLSSSL